LRACDARDGRERDSSRGHMQKSTAQKSHGVSPQSICVMQLHGSVRKITPIFDVGGRGLATAFGP
jgi:hypothetical protein